MEHTKEPWIADGTLVFMGNNEGGFDIRNCPAPEAYARRIVACVNACAEISTATLEQVGLDVGNELVKLKQQRDEHKADAEIAIALCQKAEAELIALRAAITEAEKVEPDYRAIADAVVGNLEARSQVIYLDLEEELAEEIMQEVADTIRDGFTTPQPAIPAGWLRAVDEAMVCSHLGVADASDSYEVAKKKLNDLICWNVEVDRYFAAAPKPENSHD